LSGPVRLVILGVVSSPAFYSTGSWLPHPGQEEPFLEAWKVFTGWATTMPGAAGEGLLVRDLRDRERFVSFLPWESLDAIKAWKAHPEFKQRMGLVQQHVDKFAPTETEVVARVTARS
jgi:heme-degrading monooxygenase HmoA